MGKRKYIIWFIVLFLGFTNIASAEMYLFVGDGCPHCEDIEQYIEENDLYAKLDIRKFEIFKNLENRQLYLQKTAELGFESDAVPLLINNRDHVEGSTAIEKYFEGGEELNQNNLASVLNNDDIKDLNKILKEEEKSSGTNRILTVIIGLFIGISFFGVFYLVRKKK